MEELRARVVSYSARPSVLVGAGLVLGATTVFPYLFWLVPLAFFPVLVFISQSPSRRALWWKNYLFGLGFFAAVYAWVWGTYPLTWIGLDAPVLSLLFIALAWIVTSAILATTISVRIGVVTEVDRFSSPVFPYLFALGWVLGELLQAVTFEVLWSGAQGVIGGHWSFGSLGYALAEVPVVRSLAALGGVYLLSFCAVLVSVAVFHWVMKKCVPRHLSVALCILAVCAVGMYGISTANSGRERTALLTHTQFRIPAEEVTQRDVTQRSLHVAAVIASALDDGVTPDIVIFPEGSAILNYLPDAPKQLLLERLAAHDTLIVNPSNSKDSDGRLTSSIWYVQPRDDVVREQKKDMLVPVGEYPPYFAVAFARLFGVSEWLDTVYAVHGYHRVTLQAHNDADALVGALQCSEIISPRLYQVLARDSGILANLASHGPFAHPLLIRHQTLKMARLHAVAADRFFLQSGNVAPTFVIDNTGRVQFYTHDVQRTVSVVSAEERRTHTPYVYIGAFVE